MSDLENGLDQIRRSLIDDGSLELIVIRPTKGQREVLREANLTNADGLTGACWQHRAASPEMQVNIMNSRASELTAGDKTQWSLAGDQLYIDLDLSEANLPPGTRLQLGSAVLEVTAEPHTGCSKF